MTVVCAGAKSILDLPRTLEVLETRGVPGGRRAAPTSSRRSSAAPAGLPVDHRVDTPSELAAVLAAHHAPRPAAGDPRREPRPRAPTRSPPRRSTASIDEAVADAERAGVGRKELTPYLLARIVELTGGRSLTANIALVRNNAALAAATAAASTGWRRRTTDPGHGPHGVCCDARGVSFT